MIHLKNFFGINTFRQQTVVAMEVGAAYSKTRQFRIPVHLHFLDHHLDRSSVRRNVYWVYEGTDTFEGTWHSNSVHFVPSLHRQTKKVNTMGLHKTVTKIIVDVAQGILKERSSL